MLLPKPTLGVWPPHGHGKFGLDRLGLASPRYQFRRETVNSTRRDMEYFSSKVPIVPG